MTEVQVLIRKTFNVNRPSDFSDVLDFIQRAQQLGIAVAVETIARDEDVTPQPPKRAKVGARKTATNGSIEEAPTPAPPAQSENVVQVQGKDKPGDKPGDKDSLVTAQAASDDPFDDDDADDDQGATDPSLTEREALEQGLAIMRNVFNAGHREQCRSIQRQFGVVKFHDIPPNEGHALYKAAVALAEQVGMRP